MQEQCDKITKAFRFVLSVNAVIGALADSGEDLNDLSGDIKNLCYEAETKLFRMWDLMTSIGKELKKAA